MDLPLGVSAKTQRRTQNWMECSCLMWTVPKMLWLSTVPHLLRSGWKFSRYNRNLVSKLNLFSLHKEIREKWFLSCAYSIAEIPAIAFQDYLETCMYLLELSLLSHKISTAEVTTLIFSIFSQVSVYLPLSKKHVETIWKSKKAGEQFHKWIKSNISEQAERSADKIRLDPWLLAWRACCITVVNTTALSSCWRLAG